MSLVRWILVVITAAVALGSILSYAGVGIGGGKSSGTEPVYYCPMHPSVVQDHPGECPHLQHDPGPEARGGRQGLGDDETGCRIDDG
jgi:hypothetical protein